MERTEFYTKRLEFCEAVVRECCEKYICHSYDGRGLCPFYDFNEKCDIATVYLDALYNGDTLSEDDYKRVDKFYDFCLGIDTKENGKAHTAVELVQVLKKLKELPWSVLSKMYPKADTTTFLREVWDLLDSYDANEIIDIYVASQKKELEVGDVFMFSNPDMTYEVVAIERGVVFCFVCDKNIPTYFKKSELTDYYFV